MDDLDLNDLKDKAICFHCIGEDYLKAKVSAEGKVRTCRYCGKRHHSITLEELADIVDHAFEHHFERTATDMDGYEWAMHKDPELDYEWERKGEPTAIAIMNAACIDEAAAEDIQRILGDRYDDFESAKMGVETHLSAEAHYEEIMPDGIEWQESWRSFEQSLKSEARFFSRSAAETLGALFDNIDKLPTRSGRSLVVNAGPNTKLDHLFRARVFQSEAALLKALRHPDKELAAPPSHLAAAGRMNAKGISTFYGATTEAIALAEVRPPVGSQVAIARFSITRALRLLNLSALSDVEETGSIFDPTCASRLGRMMFLRSFCQRMSRPVMPDDQDFEYLPTQALADYLSTEGKVPLDGILFPSVQFGQGLNAVLFHKASRCAELTLPQGATVKAYAGLSGDDDERGRDFDVLEEIPKEAPKRDEDDWPSVPRPLRLGFGEPNPIETTLSIDPDSITVHVVTRVEVKTDPHTVKRRRIEMTKMPF